MKIVATLKNLCFAMVMWGQLLGIISERSQSISSLDFQGAQEEAFLNSDYFQGFWRRKMGQDFSIEQGDQEKNVAPHGTNHEDASPFLSAFFDEKAGKNLLVDAKIQADFMEARLQKRSFSVSSLEKSWPWNWDLGKSQFRACNNVALLMQDSQEVAQCQRLFFDDQGAVVLYPVVRNLYGEMRCHWFQKWKSSWRGEALTYSACLSPKCHKHPLWEITFEHFQIHNQKLRGKNIGLNWGGRKVATLPFGTLPLDRSSGFLWPKFGYCHTVGGYLGVPIYWAVQNSMDATLMPAMMEKGPMLYGQWRGISPLSHVFAEGAWTYDVSHVKKSQKSDEILHSFFNQTEKGKPSLQNRSRGFFHWNIGGHWGKDWQFRSREWWVSDRAFFRTYPFFGKLYAPYVTSKSGIHYQKQWMIGKNYGSFRKRKKGGIHLQRYQSFASKGYAASLGARKFSLDNAFQHSWIVPVAWYQEDYDGDKFQAGWMLQALSLSRYPFSKWNVESAKSENSENETTWENFWETKNSLFYKGNHDFSAPFESYARVMALGQVGWRQKSTAAEGLQIYGRLWSKGYPEIFREENGTYMRNAAFCWMPQSQIQWYGAWYSLDAEKRWRWRPKLQSIISPTISQNAIPNGDSQILFLQPWNFFEFQRYRGWDRWDDGQRVNYALEGCGFLGKHSFWTWLGQSYTFQTPTWEGEKAGLHKGCSDVFYAFSWQNSQTSWFYTGRWQGHRENKNSSLFPFSYLSGQVHWGRFSCSAIHVYSDCPKKNCKDSDKASQKWNDISRRFWSFPQDGQAFCHSMAYSSRPLNQLLTQLTLRCRNHWKVYAFAMCDLEKSFDFKDLLEKGLGLSYQSGCTQMGFQVKHMNYRFDDIQPGYFFGFFLTLNHIGTLRSWMKPMQLEQAF